MGLDYELVNMDFPPRFTYEGYLDINPMGTVPTFIDGNSTLTESAGICQYLVEKYGPTDIGMTIDDAEYGEYLNWIHRSDATLTFPQTLVLRYTRLEPEERRIPQVVDDYSQWYLSRLRAVEMALEGKEFLCANRFTIADITVAYALFLGVSLGLSERYKPNCKRYLASMMERPGWKRAQEKQKT
ncbi:putative glutathione S-transferase [marine gamma proteobacterium HTCC2143]|jgi:glutathione S-transferase|uniref:Putative glutathione S-transferase n=1 Tax=marine gamma proteobacterium HTCC2143 TaxID=247633 RepID=A0Y7W2_9GAMM|nr:putative glutathione S-transferase [marine gamma proteobacterium HTCC2143]|tara:strand:- start:8751 stop:9305 length:555 start_codon:yes stop_codon:yes gene_type:complete